MGSETGYNSGKWYYWDGSAWVSGGIYNSEGFVLDDTLTSATLPAQAKAVGDKVNQLSEEIDGINNPFVILESGTFLDNDGTTKNNNVYRIRNKDVLDIRNITSITVPEGFSIYIFLLDKDKTKVGTLNWRGGTVTILDVITDDVCYINFAIRKDGASTTNITEYIPTVQAGMVLVSNTQTLPWKVKSNESRIANNEADIEQYARFKEDVTGEYTIEVGQAYGNVGSTITTDSSTSFRHIRIEKTDNVQSVLFNTAYNNLNISSYVQYVDANNKIVSRKYEQGQVTLATVYECALIYPENAVAVYVSSGRMSAADDHILKALRNNNETLMLFADEVRTGLADKAERNYDNIVTSVCRIAQGLGAPPQTLPAYKKAIAAGMRHLLCDVRYTLDGEIVLCHDNDIYNLATDENGDSIPSGTVLISQTNLADLLDYNFNKGYVSAYPDTKILQLSELLALCRKYGCFVHLELKETMNSTKCQKLFDMLTEYGMRDQAYFDIQAAGQATALKTCNPYFKFGIHTNLVSDHSSDIVLDLINECIGCINDYNRNDVYITCSDTGYIGEQTAALMVEHDIKLMGSTFDNVTQLNSYIGRGIPYSQMRYSLTNNGLNVGKTIFEAE